MKHVDFKSVMRFSPEKMQKCEVFDIPQAATELYCFEPGQAQRSQNLSQIDRIYVILEGLGRFTVGRSTREYKPGSALHVPAGQDHGIINIGEQRLILLVVSAPQPTTKKK